MRRHSTRIAWGLLAAFGVIFLASNVLAAANGDFRTQPLLEVVPLWLAFSSFMVVGALIVAYRPDNPIGWIFSAIALLAGAATAAIVALAVLQPTFVLDSGHTVDNPIAVAAAANPEEGAAGTALTSLAVVDQTVQPTRASLWLRPTGRPVLTARPNRRGP